MCSVLCPSFISGKKSLLLIVLNPSPCAQSHGQRDVFTVLYWITANNYIITHICLQTALHLHRSVPCWKQENSLVRLQKVQVLNMYLDSYRVMILPKCKSLKKSHLWKIYKKLTIYLKIFSSVLVIKNPMAWIQKYQLNKLKQNTPGVFWKQTHETLIECKELNNLS